MDEIYTKLKIFGKVKLNEPMSKHTTFKIGGLAKYFVIVEEIDKLIQLLNYLSGEGVEYFVLGSGSNILFQDDEYEGVIIKIKNTECKMLDNRVIEVDGGVLLGKVMNISMQNGLTGMEWSAGIPGTVGGAVRGNAGAFGQSTSDSLEKVEIWKDGEVLILKKAECDFVYRCSRFKHNKGEIILRAWFKLQPADKKDIVKKVQEIIQIRSGKYPALPSAGCFFTNFDIENWPGDKSELPANFIERGKVPAGWLVEQVGLKGYQEGGAQVGESHCNFIVNKKQATQVDVLNLIAEIKEKVYNKFGVNLEEEVEIV